MNAQNSQPRAADSAHNADLRVVLSSVVTGEQWRGLFTQWVIDSDSAFSMTEVKDFSDRLRAAGKVKLDMGAGGEFVLAVENPVKCRQCTAINSGDRAYCLLCRSRIPKVTTTHDGPWHLDTSHGVFEIKDANGATVVELFGNDSARDGRNARLMAVAPELLAALNHLQANPNDPRAHRQALDAIKNAGGAL